jgi:hypothetical protein
MIGASADEVYKATAELLRRDLVQRRGVWRAVLPHAVANRLAATALQDIPSPRVIDALVSGAPERLQRSFARRVGYLHRGTPGGEDLPVRLIRAPSGCGTTAPGIARSGSPCRLEHHHRGELGTPTRTRRTAGDSAHRRGRLIAYAVECGEAEARARVVSLWRVARAGRAPRDHRAPDLDACRGSRDPSARSATRTRWGTAENGSVGCGVQTTPAACLLGLAGDGAPYITINGRHRRRSV